MISHKALVMVCASEVPREVWRVGSIRWALDLIVVVFPSLLWWCSDYLNVLMCVIAALAYVRCLASAIEKAMKVRVVFFPEYFKYQGLQFVSFPVLKFCIARCGWRWDCWTWMSLYCNETGRSTRDLCSSTWYSFSYCEVCLILSSSCEEPLIVLLAVQLASSNAAKKQHVHSCSLVRARRYYGYYPSEQLFIKIVLYHPQEVARISTLLLVMISIQHPYLFLICVRLGNYVIGERFKNSTLYW
jgi:hypothetical protein